MITLHDYYMGRDVTYKHLLTPELRANAAVVVRKANDLLILAAGVYLNVDHITGTLVASGWRPPEVNSKTPGAARASKHMTCQAIDINDDEGELDNWCMNNQDKLEEIGLWLEHPSATKGWCHLQTVPPKSGNRVFYP
jgi:hypothetical protein